MAVERVDFIAVPTRDRERSAKFYGEALELERNPNSTETWLEFETGNVTLALVTPRTSAWSSRRCPSGRSSLRVPDVEATKEKLGGEGVEFRRDVGLGRLQRRGVFDPDGNGLRSIAATPPTSTAEP